MICPGVEKRSQTAELVSQLFGKDEHRQSQQRSGPGHQAAEMQHPCPSAKEEEKNRRQYCQSGPQVGLGHDQAQVEGGDHQHRHETPFKSLYVILFHHQVVGSEQDQGKFRHIGGLKLNKAQVDPALSISAGHADTGDENHNQQEQVNSQHGFDQALPSPVVKVGKKEHGDQAQADKNRLPPQVVVANLEFIEGPNRAGTVDHDQANPQK